MARKNDIDAPHDVLAAEEFVVPAPDPSLHHEDLGKLPPPLVGGEEPQDILAAEEFAMPSPDEAHVHGADTAKADRVVVIGPRGIAVGLLGLFTLRKAARSRRRKRTAAEAANAAKPAD